MSGNTTTVDELASKIRSTFGRVGHVAPAQAVIASTHSDPQDARDFFQKLGGARFSFDNFRQHFKGDERAFLNMLTPSGYRSLLPDLMECTLQPSTDEGDVVDCFLQSLCRDPSELMRRTLGIRHPDTIDRDTGKFDSRFCDLNGQQKSTIRAYLLFMQEHRGDVGCDDVIDLALTDWPALQYKP